MDYKQALGFPLVLNPKELKNERSRMLRYINLKLIAQGLPTALQTRDAEFAEMARGLLDNLQEKNRLLATHRCPVDERIEAFLQAYFANIDVTELRLPNQSLVLDRHGMARELSLPADGDEFVSDIVRSYRIANGVLHNPKSDRRTTKGTFHITEGGLPIPLDKKAVPQRVFARMFEAAMNPPQEMLQLPFTSSREQKAETFVSLLLRPKVCPEVPGVTPEKTMEVRFFAPGTLVSNLDFVESIFGNAGDPDIPQNDAALDTEHWTGHTGCVILAPHLVTLTKKEVGLPHYDVATERQRRDGMCWSDPGERYNEGEAFKLTCRDERGVIVTLIADNYYGYSKKEVKTQISYAANLYGNVEEEHAGGAIAFPSFMLGEELQVNSRRYNGQTFEDVVREYGEIMDVQPEGYGIDKRFPEVLYIPENASISLPKQRIFWTDSQGQKQEIPLLPKQIYLAPSGYKVYMEKHPSAPSWRLIGTSGEGVFCHKPCTVSGGGKSEISKSLIDYMHYGPIFVSQVRDDFDKVDEIIDHDYSKRWKPESANKPDYAQRPSRSVLDAKRSLGSVIKLLTPSEDYTDEYNNWLYSIPNYISSLVFVIKRFYQPSWGNDWRSHFAVDIINGFSGHELKFHDRTLVGTYLRVGLQGQHSWRTFKLRQDFAPAAKIQTEDDISASVVVQADRLKHLNSFAEGAPAYKLIENCEYRLFQRPDDAIHRGLDKQTERDMSQPGNFISNFEPLTLDQIREMRKYVVDFDAFSPPMQEFLRHVDESGHSYVVCSANPRQIDGKPTKNPRYLQPRPDMVNPRDFYVAEMGARLWRKVPKNERPLMPVNAVLMGRRNNPPDRAQGIRSLAVYNPIHYQELPELFMDLMCSLTGKSPSTTGAGSEGALTKGPFNALITAADLNNSLVSFILTQTAGFSSAAGHIGPNLRVDHDISLLIPEVWCRMSPEERDPKNLIAEQLLEKVNDFEFEGKTILGSRLGYRITSGFVNRFFGRVFDNPHKVFEDDMLRPEKQDLASFADGIMSITEAQERIARQYLGDATVQELCPPLKALVHIMAEGHFEGKSISDKEIRSMFTLESMLESDWYKARLKTKQTRDIALWQRHVDSLQKFLSCSHYAREAQRMNIPSRLEAAQKELMKVKSSKYLKELKGMLGAHPFPPREDHQKVRNEAAIAGNK